MKYDVWDVHAHLIGVRGGTLEERLDRLLDCADRVGVARICLFMGTRENSFDLSAEEFRRDNDEVLRAIGRFPGRVFGFVYLNPRHTRACLDEINRCVRDGPMVGVKLLAALHCNDPALDPIVELAERLKAPVLQHTWLKITGNLPGESTPMELAELAARHPRATLICAHSGGDWETGLRALRPHPHVYADLSGGDPASGFTEMAVRELGAGRVLYGSDIGGRSFSSQLGKVLGAGISEEDKRLVLGGNLERLLQPILLSKGIRP